MVEKRKAHYDLSRVKALVRQGLYRVTATALRCAADDFGYVEASQLGACVLDLETKDSTSR